MSYSEEIVLGKLSSLNETQETIVSIAQWVIFHKRFADKTAAIWLNRLQETNSTARRLNLIYLANEVVQQSRARGKTEFLLAWEPIIAEATALAYKNASVEIQGKLKRVVEVWRQRHIFDARILDATEKRIEEMDKARGAGGANGGTGKGRLGGALFGGSGGVPPELDTVSKAQMALNKADAEVKPAVNTANTEYAKMTDSNAPLPTPPVHAAKLSTLMKTLANAQGKVEASIRARRELVEGLEKLLQINRAKLTEDETTATDLRIRKEGVDAKKKEVEDGIMRGLSTPSSPDIPTPASASNAFSATPGTVVERPEAESFTPPPPDVEAFTPPPQAEGSSDDSGTKPTEQHFKSTTGADLVEEQPPNLNEPPPAYEPPSAAAAQANDFLNSLNVPYQTSSIAGQVRPASTEFPEDAAEPGAIVPSDPRLKRRKMNPVKKEVSLDDEMFGGANGVDEDGISALLGS